MKKFISNYWIIILLTCSIPIQLYCISFFEFFIFWMMKASGFKNPLDLSDTVAYIIVFSNILVWYLLCGIVVSNKIKEAND